MERYLLVFCFDEIVPDFVVYLVNQFWIQISNKDYVARANEDGKNPS